jgi:hypothetical protein
MKMVNTLQSIQNQCVSFKALFFLLFMLLFADNANGQNGQFVLSNSLGGDPFTIGSTASNWHSAPFLSSKKDSRIQYLYEAEELGLAYSGGYRTITSLAFNITGFSNSAILSVYEMKNITIKMGHTIANYDGYGGKEVWGIDMPLEGECSWAGSPTPEYLQVVKTPFDLIISETGWVELELDTPFVWDGVSSIVVEICKSDSGSSFPNHRYQFESTNRISSTASYTLTRSLNSIVNTGSVHTPGCEMKNRGSAHNTSSSVLTSTQRKIRPNIRFTFQCAGAPEGGDAVILSENYCLGGDVTLQVVNDEKSSGLNYQWASSPTDFGFVDIPGETQATLVVERAEVDMWYQRTVGCSDDVAAGLRYSAPIKVKGINTWDGTFWSFGTEPTVNDPVKISGDFDTAVDGSSILEACSLQVLSGTFTVKSGDIVSLKEKLFVHDDATVIFENNASLIQENDAAVNQGKIKYKRDTQLVRLLDYTYWSSPVNGMNPSQFSPSTPTNRIYHWNHLTQGWAGGAAVVNSPMIAGKGYIIRSPNGYPTSGGNVFTGVFEGVPNNGIVSVAVQGNLIAPSTNWNLIGNPYPAAIDIEKFLTANSSVLDGTIRLWTHNTAPSAIPSYPGFTTQALNYSSDDYAIYNFTGSVGTSNALNTGVNNSTPERFIGAGQSFMVEGIASGTASFNNLMRKDVSGYDNSQFFRNSTNTQAPANEKNRLWMEVVHQDGKFKKAMVGYVEGATNGVDWGYDSKIKLTGELLFYSLVEDQKLAIQGKSSPFNQNDVVHLGLSTTLSGEFILNLYQFDTLFENQEVYLLDKYTNTFHNIKEEMYLFSSSAGTFDDRFELRFTNETLSLNPNLNTKNNLLCYAKERAIKIKSNDIQINSVAVYDSAGRLLFDQNKVNTSEITITEIAKNNQLLLIQVVTDEGIKSIHKIIF